MLKNVASQRVTFSLWKSSARVENPTLAAGDFKIDLAGAGQNNVANLPTSDAAGLVTWLPSQGETNADWFTLLCLDAAGDEWEPLTIAFDTLMDTSVAAILVDTTAIVVSTGTTIPALIAALNDPTVAAIADAIWDELLAGHLTAGTSGLALSYIGTGLITTSTPVSVDSDITLYEGDDYYAADGNSLDWTDTDSVWPVLTAATIKMYVRAADGTQWSGAGSVVVAVGAGKKVRVELTAAETTALIDKPTPSTYRVRATLASGHIVTLAAGWLTVETDIA